MEPDTRHQLSKISRRVLTRPDAAEAETRFDDVDVVFMGGVDDQAGPPVFGITCVISTCRALNSVIIMSVAVLVFVLALIAATVALNC